MFFKNEQEKKESDGLTTLRTVPLIPLRDIVVFPYMVIPLYVGRELSLIHISEPTRPY